jgi:hypothetical protein
MTAPSDGGFPAFTSEVPTSARMYDYCLGGKDNFEVDRAAVQAAMIHFPMGVDEARNNRLFLYRLVRFLARDAGIDQFLDLGSGLPTQNNVHQVAQQFRPEAKVVYVDNDPVVLSHGRALLANDRSTTVIAADLTKPELILDHPQTHQLLDLTRPLALLLLSVGHSIEDDATLQDLFAALRKAVVPGSYLAFTQMCAADMSTVDASKQVAQESNYTFRVRLATEVATLFDGLEVVEPGLVNVARWRPDPTQPPLPQVDEPLRPYIGASKYYPGTHGEFGGVARKP